MAARAVTAARDQRRVCAICRRTIAQRSWVRGERVCRACHDNAPDVARDDIASELELEFRDTMRREGGF